MTTREETRDELAIMTIRFLAVDMVEKANSGHPGAPMGQAAPAYVLWTRILRHHPANPTWWNRDRFVLSCGHASALLYSLLHLSGYDLPLEELKRFRQLGSRTPGHPEKGLTPGVETTSGPLGQGVSSAVGMAIAQRMLAARYNRDGYPLFDYRTWVLVSDGDLMEGVSAEACSLAGHLGLGSLNVLYDANSITIDGALDLSCSEDVAARFAAYGWFVQRLPGGEDLDALESAMKVAAAEDRRPSLVVVPTHIGHGSPNRQDSPSAHGSPLGPKELAATKEAADWPLDPPFFVPAEAVEAFAHLSLEGERLVQGWTDLLERYGEVYPEDAADLSRRLAGELGPDWDERIPVFTAEDAPVATRVASGKVLNALAGAVPSLVGGSADLAASNKSLIAGEADFSAQEPGGRNLHFGIREHGMAAILNGLALTGLFRPYGATFLVFSDYMRPAIRLACLMELPVIYVFTHDSIFVGEDGPTHQPISQLASLRSLPGLTVLRPADARETAEAWRVALEKQDGPVALVLGRQKLKIHPETVQGARFGVERGAYVLAEASATPPHLLLLASGSEVGLVVETRKMLEAEGIATRVVSFPSWELFQSQSREYRDSVLPPKVTARLAVEAGSSFGWERWVGLDGTIVAIDGFGASAPYQELAQKFGFTPENVFARARELVSRLR